MLKPRCQGAAQRPPLEQAPELSTLCMHIETMRKSPWQTVRGAPLPTPYAPPDGATMCWSLGASTPRRAPPWGMPPYCASLGRALAMPASVHLSSCPLYHLRKCNNLWIPNVPQVPKNLDKRNLLSPIPVRKSAFEVRGSDLPCLRCTVVEARSRCWNARNSWARRVWRSACKGKRPPLGTKGIKRTSNPFQP